MELLRLDEGHYVFAYLPNQLLPGVVGGIFVLENYEKAKKLIKAMIVSGSLLSLAHILSLGPESIPSYRDLTKSRAFYLDKSDWISSEKSLPWGMDLESGNGVAYLPVLSKRLSRVTAYTPDPAETDSDPHEASCGRYDHVVKSGLHVFAVSRDMFFSRELQELFGKHKPLCGLPAILRFPDGTELKGVIMDTMHPRFSKTVDILFHPRMYGGSLSKAKQAAIEFGAKPEGHLVVLAPVKGSFLSGKDLVASAGDGSPEGLEESYPLSLLLSILSRI